MKCLCNKKVPRVARGNNFTLIVELKQIVISDEGKEITTQIEGTVVNVKICPSNGEPTTLNQGTGWQMAQTSNGAAVSINIPSTQPLGAYGIEITGTRTGGGAFRRYAKPGEGFIIVDASSDNFLTDMVRIYTITGIVGVGSSSSGDGGGATGTLNTSNSTAQTPQSGESFGGNINLHKVSKTGSYNDLLDKPTIPDAQVQADWNQTTTTAKDYIKNKPTIPSLSGYATQQWVGQQGFLTQHQSLVNYEKKMGIAGTPTLVNNTLTIPVSQLGSYYRLVVSAPTTITLPDMANETVMTITGVIVNITLSTGGSLTLSATQPIYENGLDDIEEGATFEINAIYNGAYWAVTVTNLELYNPS